MDTLEHKIYPEIDKLHDGVRAFSQERVGAGLSVHTKVASVIQELNKARTHAAHGRAFSADECDPEDIVNGMQDLSNRLSDILMSIVGQKDAWKRVPDKSPLIHSDLEHLKSSVESYLTTVNRRLPKGREESGDKIKRELQQEFTNAMATFS